MDFENEIASRVLNICFDIHKKYGEGLLINFNERFL